MEKTPSFLHQKTPVVFSVGGPVRTISQREIEFLRRTAKSASAKSARILLHGNPKFDLHEMLIVHIAGQYIQPHINDHSAKSFTVIDGEMIIVTYEKDGVIRDHFQLGDHTTDLPFLLWLQDPVFHTVLVKSKTVAFIETIRGPHIKTRYAEFAPSAQETSAVERYMAWLQAELGITN